MNARRQCGGCTACCTAMHIRELRKAPGVTCLNERPGVGCAIYHTRPASCRNYHCAWLDGESGELDRPDRTGIILDRITVQSAIPGRGAIPAVCVREARSGAFENGRGTEIVCELARTGIVVLLRGSRREIVGPPELVARVSRGGVAPSP